jgi:hypothetical protein
MQIAAGLLGFLLLLAQPGVRCGIACFVAEPTNNTPALAHHPPDDAPPCTGGTITVPDTPRGRVLGSAVPTGIITANWNVQLTTPTPQRRHSSTLSFIHDTTDPPPRS